MTDPSPFVPPGGEVPPPRSAASSPALPPPSGDPRPGSPLPASPLPAQPLPSGPYGIPPAPLTRPPWLIPVIVGGGVVVLGVVGLFVAAVVVLGAVVRDLPSAVGGPDPVVVPPAAPIAGDPGSPIAVEPLDCVGCFTPDDAARLRLAFLEYSQIGLEYIDGASFDSTVADELDLAEQEWSELGGNPESCFFALPRAPLAVDLGDRTSAQLDDHVHFPSWHLDESELYWLTEGVRLFDDSTAATEYLAGIESAVDGCASYSLPGSGWSSNVAPAAAIDLPSDVAAYGWVETGGFNRFYVIDLQRGNLVLRLALNSDGAGPAEAEFRGIAEAYAELLGLLEPSA